MNEQPLAEADTQPKRRGRPRKTAPPAEVVAPKKKRRKRQKPEGLSFDDLCTAAGNLSDLALIFADHPKMRKAVALMQAVVQRELLANPAALFARLARPTNGHAVKPIEPNPNYAAITVKTPAPRQQTVSPTEPVLSLNDIDAFIAEETPGRFNAIMLGAREIPIVTLGREEFSALRAEILQASGDMDAFRRDLAQNANIPDEQLVNLFSGAMALYRGVLIRV